MIATPTAGMLLADMGAGVIKVEPPWGDLWRYAQAVLPTDGRPVHGVQSRQAFYDPGPHETRICRRRPPPH